MTRILLLGGTSEATALARRLAALGCDAVFSYAGRTDQPAEQALPTRIGGFGGAGGLADYLRSQAITHVVDATHPFAAGISSNAVAACAAADVPLCAFERAPWTPGAGDRWTRVPDMDAAVMALPAQAARVFLAIGRQHLGAFAARPDNHYLLRLVDPPSAPLPLPDCSVIVARGPFSEPSDRALLTRHRIDLIVAKNSGGAGARAKLDAARALGLPVILLDRPAVPPRRIAGSLDEVMAFLGHPADLGV